MLTRRDLYQAHKLMVQRMGLALVHGEPDAPESPMRRQNVGAFGGIMIAVLVAAVFGIIGLIAPGGAAKISGAGALLVEQGTGALFIYDKKAKQLTPVANVASARLVLGSDDVSPQNVSQSKIAELPRGDMIGIPGAPTSLPEADNLAEQAWSVCTQVNPTSRQPYVTVVVGKDVGGRQLQAGEGLAVEADGGQAWLLAGGRRYHMQQRPDLRGTSDPVATRTTWLNAVDAGDRLQAPQLPDAGQDGRGPGGTSKKVGTVYEIPSGTGGDSTWAVQLRDGIKVITEFQAYLLLAESKVGQTQAEKITTAQLEQAGESQMSIPQQRLPEKKPKVRSIEQGEALCVVHDEPGQDPRFTIGAAVPKGKAWGEGGLADRVAIVPPGGGALAGAVPGPNRKPERYDLITKEGRFAVPSAEVLRHLGYTPSQATQVQTKLINLIPEGPALDPAAAQRTISAQGLAETD